LKDAVRKHLEKRKESEDKASIDNAILDALVEKNPVEVPAGMAKNQAQHMAANMLQQFGQKQAEQLWKNMGAQLTEESLPRATRSIQIALILEAVAKAENMTVSDEEAHSEIEKEATRMGTSASALQARYKKEDLIHLKERLLADKVLDVIKSKATLHTEQKPLRSKTEV